MNEAANRFHDVPRTARGHLGLAFYEAVCRLVLYLQRRSSTAKASSSQPLSAFPFLASYWTEVRQRFGNIEEDENFLIALSEECRQWEDSSSNWLPLRSLRELAPMDPGAISCLVLAGMIEEDARFGELFHILQRPLDQRRPTLGLLRLLIHGESDSADAWGFCAPLIEMGLLVALNLELPRAEWAVRVPTPVWHAVRGDIAKEPLPGSRYHAADEFVSIAELFLATNERARLFELSSLLRSKRTQVVIMRGLAGSPRTEVLGSLAKSLGYGLLEIEGMVAPEDERSRLSSPVAALLGAMPVLNIELAAGETLQKLPLSGFHGPMAISMGCEGGLSGEFLQNSITFHLPPETSEQRLLYWKRELNDQSEEDLRPIAGGFALGGGHIRRIAKVAAGHAAMEGRTTVKASDVRQAARFLSNQQLEFLANRLEGFGTWSDLVVPLSTENALHALSDRCRHREHLANLLGKGLPGGLNRGVRALFEGPSGTGKTFAARVLAAELGLDLYRVDLAAVMNKYIGETEKNLSKVLSRAEDLDVILLLDEGDSLMTRRTDVKTAHDRYANLETNYLLQRLETYAGIVIVTTNIGRAIDTAFRRRIDAIVKFVLPAAEERWRLWQLHLPSDHAVQPVELDIISIRYEMTGGQIRNASVQAALLAMQCGGPIKASELRRAIHEEYRKSGAAIPIEDGEGTDGHEHRLAGFLSSIS